MSFGSALDVLIETDQIRLAGASGSVSDNSFEYGPATNGCTHESMGPRRTLPADLACSSLLRDCSAIIKWKPEVWDLSYGGSESQKQNMRGIS